MNIFASSYNERYRSIFDLHQNYGDQFLWIMISFLAVFLLFLIDHRFFYFFTYPIYAFAVVLLLAVLVFGVEVHNSRSWLNIFGFRLQPSEFVKIAVALAIAHYLSGFDVKTDDLEVTGNTCRIIGFPVILISLQPDFGTAMVFTCFILVLYREGLPGWIMGFSIFIAVLFLMTLSLIQSSGYYRFALPCSIVYRLVNQKLSYSLFSALVMVEYSAFEDPLPGCPF